MPIIITPSGAGPGPPPADPTDGALFVGLESTFTYNGVTLNDLSQDDKYRVTQIGGLHTADIRDSREVFPARDGEIALSSYYAGRTITLTGRIECYHDHLRGLRLMEYELSKALAPLRESTMFIDCGALGGWNTQIDVRQSQPLAITEEIKSYNQYRDFMITLRASDPVIKSQTLVSDTYTAVGTSHTGAVFTQTHYGNYYAYPVFELVGPMNDPVIIIGDNTLEFAAGTTVPLGDTWTVDSRMMTVVDSSGNSQIGSLDFSSSKTIYFEPDTASQLVIFNASGLTAATSSFTCSFRHSWL